MNFCFGITDKEWNQFLDPSIYNVKFQHKEMYYDYNENNEREIKYRTTDLDTRPCQKDDFGFVEDYFHSLDYLDKLFCLDKP